MGYQPDPVLGALNTYRLNLKSHRPALAMLGWLVFRDKHSASRSADFVTRYFEGARQRAHELGFALDIVESDTSPAGQKHAARVLEARGIRGVMLPPVRHGQILSHFPWNQFSAISFGYSLAKPHLTRVTFDHVSGMTHMLMALADLGYRKVGLHITTDSDATERTQQVQIPRVLEGAYLSEHTRLFGPPPAVLYETGEDHRHQFRRWTTEHKMDAVILHGAQALQNLQATQLRVPEDLGVALCMRDPENSTYAGIDQNDQGIGRQAVDALEGLLRHNQLGEPSPSIRILVSGGWRTGNSVRRIKPNRRSPQPH